jgi:hypothetical protein
MRRKKGACSRWQQKHWTGTPNEFCLTAEWCGRWRKKEALYSIGQAKLLAGPGRNIILINYWNYGSADQGPVGIKFERDDRLDIQF